MTDDPTRAGAEEEQEPALLLDHDLWTRARDEAQAREARASTVRFWACVSAIGVSLAAMLATFVGFPLAAAMSVLLGAGVVAWAVVSCGTQHCMPRDAPASDQLRSIVLRAWGLLPSRQETAVLVQVEGVFTDQARILAEETDAGWALRREARREPEVMPLWFYGDGV